MISYLHYSGEAKLVQNPYLKVTGCLQLSVFTKTILLTAEPIWFSFKMWLLKGPCLINEFGDLY